MGASTFRQARELDPNAFRLVPQNEDERQRRLQAEAEDAALRRALAQLARGVHLWSVEKESNGSDAATLQSITLMPPEDAVPAPLTALAVLNVCSEENST